MPPVARIVPVLQGFRIGRGVRCFLTMLGCPSHCGGGDCVGDGCRGWWCSYLEEGKKFM
jgi:hypothetical protein